MSGIDRGEARTCAHRALLEMGSEGDIVLQDGLTAERDFGWVFFPIARRYLETKNPGDLIPGVGPIAVDRASGVATFLPTSVDPATAIAEHERAWRERTGTR